MAFTLWLRNLQSAWKLGSEVGNPRRPARCHAATGRRPRLEFLEDRLCLSALALAPTLSPADPATQARVSQAYGQLPLSFEANHGQTDAAVNFLSHGSGYTLFLTPAEAVLALQKSDATPGANAPGSPTGDVLDMQLVGGNAQAPATGLDAQAGTTNYLIGNDPGQWHTGITSYGRVEYQNVYPGVDLVYYGNQRQLEYDFIVAAGADPGVITLAFQGAQDMTLDAQGDLVLHTAGGDVMEQAPVLYQDIGGVRQAVAGSYVLHGDNQVGFAVGAYDRSQPLVIDPVLSYSTYLGGSGDDLGRGIAVDAVGNAYVTGMTTSTNFPTSNPLQAANVGGYQDAFVTELNATGTSLVYSTYLGGSGTDEGQGIAVDAAGSAYVTGWTSSTNFPTSNPLQSANKGVINVFVAKLNATGTALAYATYLGGSSYDYGYGIAVDSAGSAYVTGSALSTNFPTKTPVQSTRYGSGGDAFVTKLNATGTALVYSTYLGGSSDDVGEGIAVDGASNVYVTGYTSSSNFPTKHPFQAVFGSPDYDAFAAKLSAAGTALVYSTYLGGSGTDRAYGIAVDSAGDAYVTGRTDSLNFPTQNALQAHGGGYDAFVTELNATGTALVYSTYLGGSSADYGQAIAVDGAGNAYVTGFTTSSNFPTKNALQNILNDDLDAFVAKLSASGTALVYSTLLGGNGADQGYGIAVDSAGNAYVTGQTSSTTFPTSHPVQAANGGSYDVFVAKLNPRGFVLATPANVPAGSPFNVTVTATDASGNVATGYTGTVGFSSSDGSATLPASYTFTPADQGVHTFAVTLNTLGSQSLTVTDNTDPNMILTGTSSSIVVIGPATQFVLSGPTSATAGAEFGVGVTATDALGDVAIYYTGTVQFTSSDRSATLPASYTFTAADQGRQFFGVTLTTAGTQSVTATDASGIAGTDPSIVISAAAASRFVFTSCPASVSAGTAFSVTIAVTDAYGNIVTGYTGKVHFADSAGSTTLPKDYTFTASDQGVHTFTGLVLRKKGVQALTVSDTYNSSIVGSASVDVL